MSAGKSDQVQAMFGRIAGRYDLMNGLMTGGRHHAWRRAAARAAAAALPGAVLDLATGTGDLARAIRAETSDRFVVGADFSEGMLAHARRKIGAAPGIALTVADAATLPFEDGTFACVTSAFLLRNLQDLPRGLEEMRRVTRPGGLVVTLDILRPASPLWARLFGLYFRHVVPAVGAVIAGDRQAYTYLPDSVYAFVSADELARLMEKAGLRDVRHRRLGLGTIALHTGVA
ncbi:MAG TPA: ubiquinone/menaquinone biosynthesis methyltransferase [Methylomirabilota bacterium]|jgi:demethylmenaquinone methyltransferase/2-methoxy-6-polyprenyl-1,4-benzoquinol methylase